MSITDYLINCIRNQVDIDAGISILISSPERSKQVQDILFKCGYLWRSTGCSHNHLSAYSIDIWYDNYLTYSDECDSSYTRKLTDRQFIAAFNHAIYTTL